MQGRKPVIKPLGDNDVVELPSSIARMPEPPKSLKGRAREVWRSVVGELVVRNIYASDCRDMTAAYCIQYARFLDAEDQIAANGIMVPTVQKDILEPNPRKGSGSCSSESLRVPLVDRQRRCDEIREPIIPIITSGATKSLPLPLWVAI
jgi:P27 family predicted phage terminase small subunit